VDEKWKARAYRVHPPRLFVGDYIQQVGGQGARPLRGLARLPHIDDNGNVRCFTGYDPETGLYNDKPIELAIPPIVSLDEARQLTAVQPYLNAPCIVRSMKSSATVRSIQRISAIGDAGRTGRTVGTLCWKHATIKTPTLMSLPSNARTPKGVRDSLLETTTCATYCLILDGRVQTWRMGPQIALSAGSHVGVDASPALAEWGCGSQPRRCCPLF
jgi:hypothetical protein